MNPYEALDRIWPRPIFAVVRAASAETAVKAARAAAVGGIKVVEVALTTPGAYRVIADLRREHGGDVLVGAGAVTTLELADRAIKAGAQFVAMPHTGYQIFEFCMQRQTLAIPSGATPSEIVGAWGLSVPFVRVFPAWSLGGPSYVHALKDTLDTVRLQPAGGVTPENMKAYFRAGASAVAVGSGLFPHADLQLANFTAIGERARALVRAYEKTT
jgi:2-dehydro-3-deoxyphosphogluconate aldolase / (4S)-4-hydroxy-2-oxoglutarate aldolase